MRRISPRVLPLVLVGAALLLALLGTGAGVASFVLLRAGYGFLVWGLLPPLVLLLLAVVLIVIVWRAGGGPGAPQGRSPDEGSSDGPPRRGPRRGDGV